MNLSIFFIAVLALYINYFYVISVAFYWPQYVFMGPLLPLYVFIIMLSKHKSEVRRLAGTAGFIVDFILLTNSCLKERESIVYALTFNLDFQRCPKPFLIVTLCCLEGRL